MKIPRIATAMDHLDGDLVASACVDTGRRRPVLQKWGSLAACLAVILCALLVLPLGEDGSHGTLIGGIERPYSGDLVRAGEYGVLWPWEYKTTVERYPTVRLADVEYVTRGRTIGEAYLGETIGVGEGEGYDIYEDRAYTESFSLRRIRGISDELLAAVEMDGVYYVYLARRDAPATLGQLIEAFALTENLPLRSFGLREDGKDKGYYALDDDTALWGLLAAAGDAEVTSDDVIWQTIEGRALYFTATSEVLGAYKLSFCITEEGYVSTNLFGYRYLYDIGEEAAGEILTLAMAEGKETDFEPYACTLAGTVTEIGDGYLLIDDSVLCENEAEGMCFKVLTDALTVRRYVEYVGLSLGELVVVSFTGDIGRDADRTVAGAYDICPGILMNGSVAVPE